MNEEQGFIPDQGQEPQTGDPQGSAQLPDEYQGKSLEDLIQMNEIAKRQVAESTDRANKERRAREEMLSQYQLDMQRFNSRREAQSETDQTVERFRKYVNPSDEVIDTVRDFSVTQARKALAPEINSTRSELDELRAQLYNQSVNNFFSTNPEAVNLKDDIANVGKNLGDIIYQNIKASVGDEKTAAQIFNKINYDPRVLPYLHATAKGMKSSVGNNPAAREEKKQLASSGNPSTAKSEVLSEAQFKALSADKQKEYLKRVGML